MRFGITAPSPIEETRIVRRPSFIRRWLVSLIREAVRAEVDAHFKALEDKTALIEASFSSIALRVKEKQEQQKPQRPRTWKEARERLEAESQQ